MANFKLEDFKTWKTKFEEVVGKTDKHSPIVYKNPDNPARLETIWGLVFYSLSEEVYELVVRNGMVIVNGEQVTFTVKQYMTDTYERGGVVALVEEGLQLILNRGTSTYRTECENIRDFILAKLR